MEALKVIGISVVVVAGSCAIVLGSYYAGFVGTKKLINKMTKAA